MALSVEKYEYMNEDAIDDELKCIICTQPLQSPVNLDCQHTFCQICIEAWIAKDASCPICRRQLGTKYVLTTVTTPTICNQLDCLPIRCLRCNKIGIKRIKFKKHLERCSKSQTTIVSTLFKNRWRSMRRNMLSRYNRPTRAKHATELIGTNHHQQQRTYSDDLQDRYLRTNEQQYSNFHRRIFPDSTSTRSTIQQRFPRIQNRNLQQTSEWNRKSIKYLCIFIVAILFLFLISFEGAIIRFFQILGSIFLLFVLWILITRR